MLYVFIVDTYRIYVAFSSFRSNALQKTITSAADVADA